MRNGSELIIGLCSSQIVDSNPLGKEVEAFIVGWMLLGVVGLGLEARLLSALEHFLRGPSKQHIQAPEKGIRCIML